MKKGLIAVLLLLISVSFISCSNSSKQPISANTSVSNSESSSNNQSVSNSEEFAEEINETMAGLKQIAISTDIKKITEDEVTAYGINRNMKKDDIVNLLGEPIEKQIENDEVFEREVYVYDGVRIAFINTMYGEPYEAPDLIEAAEFSNKDIAFPRGIKIGDTLYQTLEKLPREYDYRTGYIYGNPYDKNNSKSAIIGYLDNNILEISICCGYWPLIKIRFNAELKMDLITIVYNSNGIGT